MKYTSTRNSDISLSSKEAVLRGLSDDGGLFVSDDLPDTHIDFRKLMGLPYGEMAYHVMKPFLSDYSEEELRKAIKDAYTGRFESETITPVTRLKDYYLLELYHGPTDAFKDLALTLLPRLMSAALGDRKVMILTATSGDTGKAALEGFRDVDGIGISVFYPYKGVSDIQELQMSTQEGSNVSVAAVRGNFDDCQTMVKKLFGSLRDEACSRGVTLSSANSINIGRLAPQVVYYVFAYSEVLRQSGMSYGEKVDFVVPTGNFGDILAGYYAYLLGLPIERLVVASNANHVLTDFFDTGLYQKNRPFRKTISPSMDILVSSNLERLLYYLSDCDAEYTKGLMKDLSEKGSFEVSAHVFDGMRALFDAGYSDEPETRAAIGKAFREGGRLIDPHTAVGFKVAEDMGSGRPTVILSTASPFKFAKDVYTCLFESLPGDADGFAYMKALSEKTGEDIPSKLSDLREKPVLHREVLSPENMSGFVAEAIKSKL